jgi:hypothetical protein
MTAMPVSGDHYSAGLLLPPSKKFRSSGPVRIAIFNRAVRSFMLCSSATLDGESR